MKLTRTAAATLPFLLLMVTLLAASPAQARTPSVEISAIEEVRIDCSVHETYSATFGGTVSVRDNEFQTATVSLSIDAGSWQQTITPSVATVTGNSTIQFTAAVTADTGAPEGKYFVRVFAKAETPGSPVSKNALDTVTVTLVKNRVRLETELRVREAKPGQTVVFPVKLYNDGKSSDQFSSTVRGTGGLLDRVNFLLDQASLDVSSGDYAVSNVEVSISPDAPPGNYTAVFRAQSRDAPNSTRVMELTVHIAAPRVPVQAGPGPNYFLLVGVPAIFLVMGLAAFIGGTEVGLLAFLQFVLVPLFVRIKKEKVLDHFARGQIFGFVKANPGTHYLAIQEHMEMENGVLAYHLKVLEREEFIVSQRDGIYKRFYPRHMKIPSKERQLSRVQRDIISALGLHPGTSQNGLSRMLGESKQVIGYHIRVLSKAGLVRVEKEGQMTRCFLTVEGETPRVEPEKPAPAEIPDIIPEIRA